MLLCTLTFLNYKIVSTIFDNLHDFQIIKYLIGLILGWPKSLFEDFLKKQKKTFWPTNVSVCYYEFPTCVCYMEFWKTAVLPVLKVVCYVSIICICYIIIYSMIIFFNFV